MAIDDLRPRVWKSAKIGKCFKALQIRENGKFIGFEGPRGCAKTRSILTDMVLTTLRWPGSRVFLARETRESLTQTVLTTLENQVFPSLGLAVPGGSAKEGRSVYRICNHDGIPNGSELVPLGLDDPSQKQRLQSSEWTKGYIAEATGLEFQQVMDVGATIRHYPAPDASGAMPNMQVVFDWNPVAPGSWVYKKTEDFDYSLGRIKCRADYDRLLAMNLTPAVNPKQQWKRVIVRYPDNPGYWDLAKWDWTDRGKDYVTDSLDYYTGYQRRRWLDGEPAAASGTVFPEFDDAVHVVDDFIPPVDWPWFVGWDPGFDHPTAIIFVCVAPNGDLYVGDEIYSGGYSVFEHVNGYDGPDKPHHIGVMRKLQGRNVRRWYGDPNEFFSSRAQGESCAIQCRKAGIGSHFYPWAKQDKQAMVNGHRELVQNVKRGAHPCLFIMRKCKNTIMEYQTWSYKRKADGSVPDGDDAYVNAWNHALDTLVGMTNTGMLRYKG